MDRHDISTCAFVKVDCEGAEYEILYRTPPAYLARIKHMAIKYHATEDKQRKAAELMAFLKESGFDIVAVDDHAGGDDGLLRVTR
jgi:hypothetical protein